MTINLKETLINSLEKSANCSQFFEVIQDLKKNTTEINPLDDKNFENIVVFLDLLKQTIPTLLDNHPHNQQLIEFYRYCKALADTNELKAGHTR